MTGQWSDGAARGMVNINSGTGQFANASGSADFTSTPDRVDFQGTLTFDASDGGGQ